MVWIEISCFFDQYLGQKSQESVKIVNLSRLNQPFAHVNDKTEQGHAQRHAQNHAHHHSQDNTCTRYAANLH
jgi:hypothetical protein